MSTTSDVQVLYIGLLGRAADPSGLAYWVGEIDAGTLTLEELRSNIVNEQPEYANGLGLDTRSQLVNALYENMFERAAGTIGLNYWVDGAGSTVPADQLVLALQNGASATDTLTLDNKVEAATYYTANTLQAAYTNAKATASVSDVDSTAASVTASKANTDAGGDVGENFTLTTGVDNFTGTAGDDTFTAANTTLSVADTVNGASGTDTLNYIDQSTTGATLAVATISNVEVFNIRNINGTAAVTGVTAVNETQTVTVTGTATATAVVNFMGIATATVATAATATTIAAAIVTAKADILAGTAAVADGLTDISSAAGVLTLTFGGLNGKGDVANVAASATSNGASFTAGTEVTKGVAGVAAAAAAGFTDAINADNIIGATEINSDRSTQTVTITNLATDATAGMKGNGSTTNGALNFGYKTAADAATLNVSGGTLGGAVAITSTPVAVTINSTGAANIIGTLDVGASATGLTINATTGLTSGVQTGAALATITVTGAAATAATPVTPAVNDITSAVQLGTLAATVTTIDASAMTAGGVSATLLTGITSFKGGAGIDTVGTANTTSQVASIIDAGAGTDVLRITAYADIDTATEAQTYANFETVDSGVLTGTAIDMSLFTNSTITALRTGVAAASSFSNVTAAQAADVTIYGDQATTTTLAVVGATISGQIDTINLKFNDGLVAEDTLSLANLVVAGVEKINIEATDHATIALMTSATSWTNSTVTGTGDVSITTGALAANANTTIDASALTGTMTFVATSTTANGYKVTGSATGVNTLTGSTLSDTFIGGSAADTITGAAGSDTMTGGAGADIFIYSGIANITGGTPSATVFDTITDFATASDIIRFDTTFTVETSATATAGVAKIDGEGIATFVTADDTLAERIIAVQAAIVAGTESDGDFAVFEQGGNSYVFINADAATLANVDSLIQLTGVTGLSDTTITTTSLTIA